MKTDPEVIVIGAGLAGLRVADRLTAAGRDVQVVEAADRVGGRVRASPTGLDAGGAFVGPGHVRTRRLVRELGLSTRPAGLSRAPVRWALPAAPHTSWTPPHTFQSLRLGWRLHRMAARLDSLEPWSSSRAASLDRHSVGEFLDDSLPSPAALHVWRAMIAGFATVPPEDLSLLQLAWWIRQAGGPVAAIRSGSELVIRGGAHQLADQLAARLSRPVATGCPVRAIRHHHDLVEVATDAGPITARRAVVAVPLPALHDIDVDTPAFPALRGAVTEMAFGACTKIVARIDGSLPAHRVSIGDPDVPLAWRVGRQVSGMALGSPASSTGPGDALARAMDLPGRALVDVTAVAWHEDPWIGGTYLAPAPGQLTGHAAGLGIGAAPVWFAASERSSHPTSMEGALAAADAVTGELLRAG